MIHKQIIADEWRMWMKIIMLVAITNQYRLEWHFLLHCRPEQFVKKPLYLFTVRGGSFGEKKDIAPGT